MKTGFDAMAEELAQMRERQQHAEKAVARARAIRAARLKDLHGRAYAVRTATDLYKALDVGEHPEVRIRKDFIRLGKSRPLRAAGTSLASRNGDAMTRPPLTKLIYRPSNALQVYSTGLYVAHQEFEPGKPVENRRQNNFGDGWVQLCGLRDSGVSTRELNLRLTRALKKLERHGLVAVSVAGNANRFDGFRLNREDASGHWYSVPSAASITKSISLPSGFFRAGWHLILTSEELATLLIIVELTHRLRLVPRKGSDEVGVALPDSWKWGFYGLAHEAYASLHELREFGLIDVHDPNDRNRGKIPDSRRRSEDMRALRLIYPPPSEPNYAMDAIDTVAKCLTDAPIPPRLQED
ncbi:hypothetical protein ACTXG5_11100 [Mycobacterium sp. Dal123C01]|uniref:hypothetical protein n=1 Tax=Mycobacterium sp. Dal123C01 TaxID=3457577 RepID=UPI00403E3AB1